MARPKGLVSRRPKKPRPNFPLFAHAGGSWCATIDGRRKTFGGWKNDPKGERAVQRYEEFIKARREGREPVQLRKGVLAVRDVVNALLDDREAKLQSGHFDAESYADYRNCLRSFMSVVGPDRNPYDLTPAQFAAVRTEWAKTRGPHALGRWVRIVRTAFQHAGPDGIGLMDRPPRYGGTFKQPSALDKRRAKRENEAKHGKRLFTPEMIRLMLAGANPTLKACILLGINCGFLAIDCARLTTADVQLDKAKLEFVRRKRETERAAILWPETVKAIRAAIKVRPEPRDEADADLLFLTRGGWPLIHKIVKRSDRDGVQKVLLSDSLNQATADLLTRLKLKKKGLNFSACRKTFRSAADEVGDTNAARLVMGHLPTGIDEHYVIQISDERLKRIADHVRSRLLTSHKGSGRVARATTSPASPPPVAPGSEGTAGARRSGRGSGDARPGRSKRTAASRRGKAA